MVLAHKARVPTCRGASRSHVRRRFKHSHGRLAEESCVGCAWRWRGFRVDRRMLLRPPAGGDKQACLLIVYGWELWKGYWSGVVVPSAFTHLISPPCLDTYSSSIRHAASNACNPMSRRCGRPHPRRGRLVRAGSRCYDFYRPAASSPGSPRRRV